MKKVVLMTSRMGLLLLGLSMMVTCFAGAADAAQYLAVADFSAGTGGVEFWDISAATPTLTSIVHGTPFVGDGGIYGVAFGPNNDVFVTVSGSQNVYRAPYAGNGVWTDYAWTVAFTLPTGPLGLSYDSSGNKMYVASPGDNYIYNWDFDTGVLGSNSMGLSNGYDVAVVVDKVWMSFGDVQVVGRFNITTGLPEAMNATWANPSWPDAPGGGTFGVCGAPDGSTGTAYYTGRDQPYIYKYRVNSPGNWDRVNNSYNIFINDPVHLSSPMGIAIGTDRNGDGVRDFFVADYSQKMFIYSGSDGAYLGTFATNPINWWGTPRYIAITAGNSSGLPTTNPIEPASLSVGKTVADDQYVHVRDRIATSSLSDTGQCFYIEEADRSCGMRVVPRTVSGLLQRGSIVDVYGTMETTTAGERQIVDSIVYVTGTTTALDPVGMNNRALGGGNFEDSIHNQGQYGVPGGSGTNNIGLLVRVWGRVIESGTHYVVIDDGSGVGVRVDTTAAPNTPSAGYIAVTGVSSLYGTKPNGTPLILVLP